MNHPTTKENPSVAFKLPSFLMKMFLFGIISLGLGCQESDEEKGLILEPTELDFSEIPATTEQEITATSEAKQVITILDIAAFADGAQLSANSAWLKHETALPLPYFLLPEHSDSVAFKSNVAFHRGFLPQNISQAEIEFTYRIADGLPQYITIPIVLRASE